MGRYYKIVLSFVLAIFMMLFYQMAGRIFDLIGGKPEIIREVKISEIMKKDESTFIDRLGVWEKNTGYIIIHRNQLQNLKDFSGTLLHEVGHALSNAPDVNRNFEATLTNLLGIICNELLTLENK